MEKVVRLGLYSTDPPALDSFHALDPESYSVLSAIADGLTMFDEEGRLQPALAIAWERRSPTEVDFELRQGVTFHNGEPFDADSVVATFTAHADPRHLSATGQSPLLSVIKGCQRLDRYRVRLRTHVPDCAFFNRLPMFTAIYPASVLTGAGPQALYQRPIGTGPFQLERWDHGSQIVLRRFPRHWRDADLVDRIHIPIVRQGRWIGMLARGELDVAFHIDAIAAAQATGHGLHVSHRQAALSRWFLLRHRGPLADRRVRQALNLAIHKHILCEVAENRRAVPQTAIGTQEQFGHNQALRPYPYDPARAADLLREAGHGGGFPLHGLVSDGSIALYLLVKEFLGRIGVRLEASILPRGEWVQRMSQKQLGGPAYDGDFALFECDNPTLHTLFHHSIMLYSKGPFALLDSPEYDRRFLAALSAGEHEAQDRLRDLDRYVHEEALLLLTTQLHVYAAARPGYRAVVSRNGHFDTVSFLHLGAPGNGARPPPVEAPAHAVEPGVAALLAGTSHLGVFHLEQEPPPGPLRELWHNLLLSQERWQTQITPMLREIVDQIEARTHLRNILSSTAKVGILGLSRDGRRLFANDGLAQMVGDLEPGALDQILAQVEAGGSFLGPVVVAGRALLLTAALALNETGTPIGYTLVFSDFSGEEERIRHQAVRDIVDNVACGFFVLGPDLVVQDQCTRSCQALFGTERVAGRPLFALLPEMTEEQREIFQLQVEQVFEDFIPTEATLGQAQTRFLHQGRVLHIEGRAIRDGAGAVKGILFTVMDHTELEASQRESQHHQRLVSLMRRRESFREFLGEAASALQRARGSLAAGNETIARRALHTLKGNAGAYGLAELMALIHEIEGQRRLASADLDRVYAALDDFLSRNHEVLGLRLGEARRDVHQVTQEQLRRLQGLVVDAAPEAAGPLRAWLAQVLARPAHVLLGPLDQMVARIAERQGKQVRFVLEGADTPVDVRHMTPVFQNLPHLLRNAIDHGLEPPALRGGKPEQGTLCLSIRAGAEYTIVVRDDGRGIDEERLLHRAVALGVLDWDRAAVLGRRERIALIFHEGLSTAETITEISGRGVGLAAVQAVVAARGGQIDVQTSPGHGTHVTLRVPRSAQEADLGEQADQAMKGIN